MRDITTIPIDELRQDLKEAREFILTCQTAIKCGITRFRDGMLVAQCIETDTKIVGLILAELYRRKAEQALSN